MIIVRGFSDKALNSSWNSKSKLETSWLVQTMVHLYSFDRQYCFKNVPIHTSNLLGIQYSQCSDTSYVALWRIIRIFNSFRCIPLSISVYTNRLKGTNCTYHRKGMTITYVKKRLHNDNFSQKLNGLKSILIKDKLLILTVNS